MDAPGANNKHNSHIVSKQNQEELNGMKPLNGISTMKDVAECLVKADSDGLNACQISIKNVFKLIDNIHPERHA